MVFTNGCFDVLHRGHVYLLERAKSYGDILVVGLNSDRSVRKIKGKGRPVKDQVSRAQILSSLYMVDYVVLFDEETPDKLIKRVRPQVLVKGGDWKPGNIVGADFVESYGGKVKRIKYLEGHSSSYLIRRMRKSRAG